MYAWPATVRTPRPLRSSSRATPKSPGCATAALPGTPTSSWTIATHVADARTCCLHPASSTHRQMNDAELAAAGVPADLVRLSVGLESREDLMEDLAQALDGV